MEPSEPARVSRWAGPAGHSGHALRVPPLPLPWVPAISDGSDSGPGTPEPYRGRQAQVRPGRLPLPRPSQPCHASPPAGRKVTG